MYVFLPALLIRIWICGSSSLSFLAQALMETKEAKSSSMTRTFLFPEVSIISFTAKLPFLVSRHKTTTFAPG